MQIGVEAMLDPAYLSARGGRIGDRAELRSTGLPARGGTVFLVAADADGSMVSFIQSNYMGFGSGVVVPGTGIALQNRGAGFSLDPGHPNAAGPAKRPFSTIIPGFLTRDGDPWGPIGVMGGHMQPQGHVQVVRGLVDLGLTPQAALDVPRWHVSEGLGVQCERAWPEETVEALRSRGHELDVVADTGLFGRGQIILRAPDGTLAAGTERRADGLALAF
jgi:gamma-glutamyltranspeptidase/glutathione hydrolase